MNSTRWTLAIAAAVALALVSGLAAAQSAPAMVKDGVFVGANEMTLYTFDKDTAGSGKSVCNGPCAANWPALMAKADDKPMGDWTIVTRNVIARVEGSDPQLKNEAVVFSAHWDHLGVGDPVNGDPIYNGAADNATGTAMVLEMARSWAALPQKPRRSAIFLAVTAEEAGLRGSHFYGEHPVVPAGKTAAALNFDMFMPYGRTSDVVLTGAERTTMYPIVQDAAKRYGFTIKPDPRPSAGLFYRSDHFSFARVGIPSFSIDDGRDLMGKPAGTGTKFFEEFDEKRYHQPSDEYKDDWDFSGMVQYAKFGMSIGINVGNSPKLPTWNPGDEFLPARQASGVK